MGRDASVRPISPSVGAEVVGLNAAELSEAGIATLREAWHAHGAVLLRGQQLTDDDLIAFSACFGALDHAPVMEGGRTAVPGKPEIYVISNVTGADGAPIGSLGAVEASWHSDMSYLEQPPIASVLYALEVPASGGDTWLCGLTAAAAALPADLRTAVGGLSIKHDATYNSGGFLRKGAREEDDPRAAPGAVHPIICAHPETGAPTLFLGRRRNAYVPGLPLDESEALLDRLWDHATQPQFNYAHHWRAGDLLLWDNRCTLHRRDPFDPAARRIMHRTQIKGTATPRAAHGSSEMRQRRL